MSLTGLERFRGADNATAFRLLLESRRRLLVVAGARALLGGVVFVLVVTYLVRMSL